MPKLPLFPLNLVILPYEYLPLHIFEPRYKIMITNNIEQNSPFGIIHKDGKNLYPKGCKVEVSKVYKKYQTGEYDILVRGIENFKIFNTKLDGETIVGEVEYISISMKVQKLNSLIKAPIILMMSHKILLFENKIQKRS